MTQIMLIQEFLDGATEGVSDGGHNLKIKGDKLIHFSTVIAERHKNKIILRRQEVLRREIMTIFCFLLTRHSDRVQYCSQK